MKASAEDPTVSLITQNVSVVENGAGEPSDKEYDDPAQDYKVTPFSLMSPSGLRSSPTSQYELTNCPKKCPEFLRLAELN